MSDDGRFPRTRHSVVLATHAGDAEERRAAWDAVVRAYWKPVYKHLRLRWRRSPEAAQDTTQEFFARAMEKGFFAGFDPGVARFRTFLRVCLDRLASDENAAAQRQKRGGGTATLPLDFVGAERELAAGTPGPAEEVDAAFHREWLRSLFEAAVGDLQREAAGHGRERQFAAFRRHDLEAPESGTAPTYAEVAGELGASTSQITNWLAAMRARLRQLVLARLRELCADEGEFREEARMLFGEP